MPQVLRDPSDIEDAFQATFLILVRKAPCIRDRSLLSNWLFGVAHRRSLPQSPARPRRPDESLKPDPTAAREIPSATRGGLPGPPAALGTQWQVYAGARHVMPVAGMLSGDSRNEQGHSCFGETCRMSAASPMKGRCSLVLVNRVNGPFSGPLESVLDTLERDVEIARLRDGLR